MKTKILIVALLLIAGVQAVNAQKIILHMAGNQKAEYSVWQLDSITFTDADSDTIISSNYNHNADDITSTLWGLIKSNPNYSRFANIAHHAKYYYKDEKHPMSDYSFENILKGGRVNTVWVPNNNVLTEEKYQMWMDMCETDGYKVQQQFLGNHIALWRYNISEPGISTIRMINGKKLAFDKTDRTLDGISIGEYNFPAINGVMHVLNGIVPFHYNFYEYLRYGEPQTKLGQYVIRRDTSYFSPEQSIEGLPDINGYPTYVDSVFIYSNTLFEKTHYIGDDQWLMADQGFGARINNEDSAFVMLMPTDAAWDTAYEMLKDSHKYATVYEDKSKGDIGVISRFSGLNPDSLQKKSIEMDIISPLVFNIHQQPKRNGSEMWNPDMFKNYKGEGAEFLLNTFGDTLRAVGDWNPSKLFDVEPTEMSNGIAYEVNSLNFPSEYITPDVEVEIENTSTFYNTDGVQSKYKVGYGSKKYAFSNQAYKEITSRYGEVSNNNFYYLEAPGTTLGPKVEIKLLGNSPSAYVPNAQVMSGKYDIQVVVVPRWYMEIVNGSTIDILDEEKMDSIAANNKYIFRTQIKFNNNANKDKTSAAVISTYDGLKVDTITVFNDFEFPYSYKNIRNSYPTLFLEGYTSKADAKNGFVFDLVIDKIILKRKD